MGSRPRAKHKGVMVILDGLGDRSISAFGGATPLETALTPNMDRLISAGQGGLVDPLYPGFPVGTHTGTGVLLGIPPSEMANMARGPIEAAGTSLKADWGDLLVRCNFASLEPDGEELRVLDRRAGRINQGTQELAGELQNMDLGNGFVGSLYPATGHRAVLRLASDKVSNAVTDTDPGDQLEPNLVAPCRPLTNERNAAETARAINVFTRNAYELLKDHPVNSARRQAGLLPANGIICRSPGMRTQPASLINRLHLKACLVAGESTVIGLGRLLGYQIVHQPGFTAMPDTDLAAKIAAATAALEDHDIVFLHIKGPDISAHDRDPETKRRLLEAIDQALPPLLEMNPAIGITGDHSTDCNSGHHTGDPVPSLLYSADGRRDGCAHFGESDCMVGGLGRLPATGFLCSLLDAMGQMHKFTEQDRYLLAPVSQAGPESHG